eukprot:TRINITY_DN70640_c0_g1_i1.p1 TRINITY_DN70640_c0_g1~~TRINITY_DN70640_c0_g1_i1.p1  ORF type:complete len:901 (-),score=130.81 TRINITY_DN70640_c0_g1_i1:179-2881(-)
MDVKISTCEASQSDHPAVLRSLARSRSIRKRHRLSSPVITARTLRWNKRRQQSLSQNPMKPTLSEEESDKPPVLPGHHRSKKNMAAFKSLPRPSELVYEVEAGSAPEAGLPKHLKQAYYRRVKATALQMQCLNPNGKPQPVPTWSRINRGLIAYSPYLQPPTQDRELKLMRTPKQLLSSYYRGTLLRVYRTGDSRPTKSSKRQVHETASSSSHPVESMVDFMYWATTSDDDTVTAANAESVQNAALQANREKRSRRNSRRTQVPEVNEPVPLPATAAEIEARRSEAQAMLSKIRAQFQKRTYVQQVVNMAQRDDDSLPSETDTSSVAPSPPPPKPANGERESSPENIKEDPEKTRDRELLRLLQGDLDEGFDVPNSSVKENRIPDSSHDKTQKELDEGANPTKVVFDIDETSCPFEREKEIAMKFCQAMNKRPRAQAFLDAIEVLPKEENRRTQSTTRSKAPEPYAMKVMKKMGFKGRLGAREDGCSVPLQARITASRSGIGAQPKEVVSYPRHLLLEYEQNQGDSHEHPKRGAKLVDVDPGPVVQVKAHDAKTVTPDQYSAAPSKPLAGKGSEGPNSKLKNGKNAEDPEDERETESEGELVDNCRRAVIIEMGAIVKDSHERRKKAFTDLISRSEDLPDKKFDLDDLYARVGHDLTDEDIIKNLYHHFHVPHSKDKLSMLMSVLDACYARLGPCELVDHFWRCKIEENVSCGILHPGSQQRMEREVEELGLQESEFLFCTFQSGEEWPYVRTWKDLFCQLGVSPQQGGIVPLQSSGILSAKIAAAVLGARVEVTLFAAERNGNDSCDEFRSMVDNLQRMNLTRPPRRRRVLFLSETDNMWYAGSLLFEQGNKALVRCYSSGELVWLCNDAITGLNRANFRKLQAIEFGGLLEPEDVECL